MKLSCCVYLKQDAQSGLLFNEWPNTALKRDGAKARRPLA